MIEIGPAQHTERMTLVDAEHSMWETPGKGDNAAQCKYVTQSGYKSYSFANVDKSPLTKCRYSVYSTVVAKE